MNIAFNDAYMGAGDALVKSVFPGFGATNRTPETNRVHKRAAASQRTAKAVRKGLSRASVAAVRLSPRKYEVVTKGSRQVVGWITKVQGKRGTCYTYQLKHEAVVHKGFASQKAAMDRMLSKA